MKRGLSKKQIQDLPEIFWNKEGKPHDEEKCLICLSEYQESEKLRILPCSHRLHKDCVDKWLNRNRTCPVCRVPALAQA